MTTPVEIAEKVVQTLVDELGPEWIVRHVAALFAGDRAAVDAILDAEYRAAELAAEAAEKEAFPK